MEDRWLLYLLTALLVLVVGGAVAIGFIYGWDTEIEMCWDAFSNQYEVCY